MIQTNIIEISSFKETELQELYNNLEDNGNLFLIVQNNIENENIFSIIQKTLKVGYFFINNIICINNHMLENENQLKNSYYNLLWFSKKQNKNKFYKDNIREKHIWKDVEWGKREKNYNPKGKDPGNVWIPTEDNGKAVITHHIILEQEEVINRILLSTTDEGENVYIKIGTKLNEELLLKERNIKIEYFKKEYIKRNFSNKIKNTLNLVANNSKKKAEVYFKTSEIMEEVKDGEIDLVVTSPPYWDLKNYFKEGQIGQESYEKYLERLNKVWKECYRILKDDGNVFININTRTKDKKPILIPGDFIKQCQEIGFSLKDIIIWHKSSGIPTSGKNLTDKYEYVLWFTKKYEREILRDRILEVNDYKNEKLNYGNIWNINRKAGSVGKDYVHPAIYPNKLVERIVNLFTNEGDTVLDPFLGSGTSLIGAISLNRNFKGYEYNEKFYELIDYRIKNELNRIEFDLEFKNLNNVENFQIYRKEK